MKLFAATQVDGYKLSHADMYADGTTQVYSNLTPRTDKIFRRSCTRFYDGKLVFFGGQAAIHEIVEMWDESFFSQPFDKVKKRFKRRVDAYLGEGVVSTKRLRVLHALGYLPLEIKTLDEGLKVPMGIPVLTITNTTPEEFWLVNYLETVLSNLTWKSATNATIAAEYKEILKHYAKLTGTDDFTVSIQAHDFSCRGMSGPEDAARSGMAHLTQFIGTDTLSAMDAIEDYYGCGDLLAISVPATEHAVSSNNILSIEQAIQKGTFKYNAEQAAILEEMASYNEPLRLCAEAMFAYDLITRKYPKGIISYVADTYDFWAVLTRVLKYLKDVILARKDDANGLAKLVIRPDSGDPVKVICGYQEGVDGYWAIYDVDQNELDDPVFIDNEGNEVPEHEVKGAIECLWETFGGEVNDLGYKVLDRHIGLIYGDSITTARCAEILERLMQKGFQSGNVVFGVGSYTYQCNTRDTFGFAVKATYSVVNGEPVNIFKDPKTDSKKKSAKGLLFVGMTGEGELELCDEVSVETESSASQQLTTRFKDGEFVNQTTLDEIRARLA